MYLVEWVGLAGQTKGGAGCNAWSQSELPYSEKNFKRYIFWKNCPNSYSAISRVKFSRVVTPYHTAYTLYMYVIQTFVGEFFYGIALTRKNHENLPLYSNYIASSLWPVCIVQVYCSHFLSSLRMVALGWPRASVSCWPSPCPRWTPHCCRWLPRWERRAGLDGHTDDRHGVHGLCARREIKYLSLIPTQEYT